MIQKNANNIIFFVFLIIFAGLEIHAINRDSNYAIDMIIVMVLFVLFYALQKKLALHWFHYLLVSLFFLSHSLGAFKAYDFLLFNIEYDFWVHVFFGIAAGFVAIHYVTKKTTLSFNQRIIFAVLVVTGLSGMHELLEWQGALVFGEGDGLLFIGAGDIDEWDT